jgi:site-specific recombinase XerD
MTELEQIPHTTALSPPSTVTATGQRLAHLDRLVDNLIDAATPASTLRAYESDLAHYLRWCRDLGGLEPLDHESVARYLADLGEQRYKISTLERRLSSLCVAFRALNQPTPRTSPRVRRALQGIRRTTTTRPAPKRALTVDELRRIVVALPDTLAGARDRALLLVGFAGALRRSELVALDVHDIELADRGLVLQIRISKTDQDHQGWELGLAYGDHTMTCAVRAMFEWLERSGITSGPVFRPVDRWGNLSAMRLNDRTVALVLQARARQAGISAENLAGHSLRSGLITAASTEISERAIAAHTRHQNLAVLRGYIRHGSLFTDNPSAAVGL